MKCPPPSRGSCGGCRAGGHLSSPAICSITVVVLVQDELCQDPSQAAAQGSCCPLCTKGQKYSDFCPRRSIRRFLWLVSLALACWWPAELDEATHADEEEAGGKLVWAFLGDLVCKRSHASCEHVFPGGEGAPEPFEKMLFTWHVAVSPGEAGCTGLRLRRGTVW